MAKLSIRKLGGGITEALTAAPGDVAAGDIFIGAGSETDQVGNITKHGAPEYVLPINGRLQIPQGQYDGGRVSQAVEVSGGKSVGPGAKQIVLNTAGKYMTGNIIIRAVKNLKPDVIKKHEYVGSMGPGTWEGYVNIDPAYLYYMGAQKDGYKATKLVKWSTWSGRYLEGVFNLLKDRISISLPSPVSESGSYKYWYQNMLVFEGLIDFGKLSRIEIQASISNVPNASRGCQVYAYIYSGLTTGSFIRYNSGFQELDPALGNSLASKNPHADDISTSGIKYYDKVYPDTFLLFQEDYNKEDTYYCNVSGISGNGYLYLGFNNSLKPYENVEFQVNTVKMV